MEKKTKGAGAFSKTGNGNDQGAERPEPPFPANLKFSIPNKWDFFPLNFKPFKMFTGQSTPAFIRLS